METENRQQDQTQTVSAENENDETDGLSQSSPTDEATYFDGHLPLHWLQPNVNVNGNTQGGKNKNNETNTLPSFRDLQLKTHRTLYGTSHSTIVPPRDKSPKGSVDAPIRHLVDLINSHSRFCTLSSCSGRISLFDPSGSSQTRDINENENDEAAAAANNNHFTEASGKGRGSWILVSHDRVAPEALVDAMVVKKVVSSASYRSHNGENGDNDGDGGTNQNDEDEDDDESKILLPPWTFRFEPMLLHIAAASLEDGRSLLTIALNLGFRESGLVVTDKRVTVAIRSHSLATATPLFPSIIDETEPTQPSPTQAHSENLSLSLSSSSSLCVPPSYLRALVKDANQRLEANWKHLDRLYRSIESVLFEVRSSPPPLVVRNHPSSSSSSIPPLNLWNASAATVSIGPILKRKTAPNNEAETPLESSKQEVWVLGGYGCGPNANSASDHKHPVAKRSSKLFKLERELSSHGSSWHDRGWRPPERSSSSDHAVSNHHHPGILEIPNTRDQSTSSKNPRLGVRCVWNQKVFPDLQGMASCRWRESLVLLWGGRKGPSKPSDVLWVLDTANDAQIATIVDVRGELPLPRWGHQLVSLESDRAVLLGGCNHVDGAFDDIFVLHFCAEQKESNANTNDGNDDDNDDISCGFFYWERLSIHLPTPRFHFGAALLNGDTIVVVGGLESTRELLQPFEAEPKSASAVWSCRIGKSRTKSRKNKYVTAPNTQTTVVTDETTRAAGSFEFFFGMACCTLLSKNLLLITGGIQQNASSTTPTEPIQAYWVSGSNSSTTLSFQRIQIGYDCQMGGSMEQPPCFEFGSLIHHCCLPLSGNELLLVGGGVPSFAFGECYASSHHLVIDTDSSSPRQKTDGTAKNNSKAYRPETTITNRSKMMVPVDPTKPHDQNNAPNGPSCGRETKEIANVVYVAPKHARQAKNSLQQKGWLEKRYRMIKIEHQPKHEHIVEENASTNPFPKQIIALPISAPFSEVIAVFSDFILYHGEEELPLSTSQYASKIKQTKKWE